MPIKLWIQERSGDYGLELPFKSRRAAEQQLEVIRQQGGYWTTSWKNERVYVPWHRVDFVRIEGEERV